MDPGEWTSACTFALDLKNVDTTLPDKPMTLIVLRDSDNVYLGFQWNHDPQGADATQYLLGLGFDFDADGSWEDGDYAQLGKNSVHTIDDALLLVYLGHYAGDPSPPEDAWIKLYLPHGLYVLSWGNETDVGPSAFQFYGISGPANDFPGSPYTQPDGLGTNDRNNNPVSFPYGVAPPELMFLGYRYTMEIAVPLALFHSPAGFGFALTHQTGTPDPETGNSPTLSWTWPTVVGEIPDLGKPESAEALGTLVGDLASTWQRGLLDPGLDEGIGEPVGGVMTTVNKPVLMIPWIAGFAMLGIAVLVVATRKRRT